MPSALGDFLILEALRQSDGAAVAVEEAELSEMAHRAARREGMVIGPEGRELLLHHLSSRRGEDVAEEGDGDRRHIGPSLGDNGRGGKKDRTDEPAGGGS